MTRFSRAHNIISETAGNNDINNYRTAIMNGIQNAGVYGKAPEQAVIQLLNSLQ